MQKKEIKQYLPYCAQQVKEHDPDRFLLSMFAPAQAHEAIWALLAFNYEIAKTREVVSESTLGHIRLQWWRDAIKGIYEEGKVLEHEVVKPLADAIAKYSLSREHFDKLIYAREFDLENVAPANIEGLFHYADFTATPLFQLCAQVLGVDVPEYDLRTIAVRYSCVGILRATPMLAKQGRVMLPQDLLDQSQISLDDFFLEERQDQIADICHGVLDNLPTAPRIRNKFFKSFNVFSNIYIVYLRRLNGNVFAPKMPLSPPFFVLRLFFRTKFLS